MLDKVKKSFDDFVAGNWSEIQAGLSPNLVYEEIPTKQRVEGTEKYIEHLKRWRRAFPDVSCKWIGGFASENMAVAEVEWEGTQTGALEGPLGTIPATNRHGSFRAVLVIKVENDKIAEIRHYFDMLTILGNLGIAPTLGAQVPPAAKEAGAAQRH